jgi:hypothetical protein
LPGGEVIGDFHFGEDLQQARAHEAEAHVEDLITGRDGLHTLVFPLYAKAGRPEGGRDVVFVE